MNEYTMIFFQRPRGVDWDAGADICGRYDSCELLLPIPLKEIDLEAAKAEAAAHWEAYLADMHIENAEGYWVVDENEVIQHCEVAIEGEDHLW